MTETEALLEHHDLSVTVEPADGNPDMPNAVEGMSHWGVVIEGGAMPVRFRVSLLREEGDPAPPSVAEALQLLRFDLIHPHLDADEGDWLGAHGLRPDSSGAMAWTQAHEAILDLRQAVCEHLPPEVAQALAGPRYAIAGPAMA